MVTIILIEPETSGNVGAVARVMGNFDVKELVLVNPQCSHLDTEAMRRAKHAKNVLKNAKVGGFELIEDYDYLVATTSKTGTDYNIPRVPIMPEELAEKIVKVSRKKVGIVFGREGKGLYNKEIDMCDFSVTIPTSSKYSALNLSHSVGIILYEFFKRKNDVKSKNVEKYVPASKTDKDVLMKKFKELFGKLDFSTAEKKETQAVVWKRLIGKSFLTKREAFALFGFVRKVDAKIKKK